MKIIKYIATIVFTVLLGTAFGQYQVPLYTSANSAGYSSDNAYGMLAVTGQNAIGPTENDSHTAYLGLLAPVRYVLTDAEINKLSFTQLFQNYPNPFREITTIPFRIARHGKVTLKVFDVLGQPVEILLSGQMPPGKHLVEFNGNKFGSGMFFYKLEVNGYQYTKTMILTK